MAEVLNPNAVSSDTDYFSYLENNNVVLTSAALPATTETTSITPTGKKRTRSVKRASEEVATPQEASVLEAYEDNMDALRTTVLEYDILAGEFKSDLDQIRASRTMKGKYHYAAEIGQTLNSILSNKVNAIKELNATIKTAKEYDYKVAKDRQAAMEGNDDKRIMDMYNAFIGAPVSGGGNRSLLGPTDYQTTVVDVIPQVIGPDVGFNNYMANITPEQNTMLFETNPDIKQVVTYNAATGEKHFAVMNMATGQEVPNVSKHDDMFLEGVTIDPRRKIARNTNLNESYPLVIYNDDTGTNGF